MKSFSERSTISSPRRLKIWAGSVAQRRENGAEEKEMATRGLNPERQGKHNRNPDKFVVSGRGLGEAGESNRGRKITKKEGSRFV